MKFFQIERVQERVIVINRNAMGNIIDNGHKSITTILCLEQIIEIRSSYIRHILVAMDKNSIFTSERINVVCGFSNTYCFVEIFLIDISIV